MKYIKGFDENLRCRDIQFEIGKTYEIKKEEGRELELCTGTVFHFCKTLQQVHKFYSANTKSTNRFCEIEVLGKLVESEDKCGSNKIRIVKEIKGKKLNELRGLINGNIGIFNTGDCNTGNWNTGDWNTGDCNTGNRNTGNCNTGDWNTGNRNTGNRNTGNWNTGDCNTGNRNTGNRNTGDCNTGDWNTGDRNTGDCNTGNWNTGDCNTGNRNTGNCNTGDWNTGNRNTGNRNTGNWNTGDWNKCNRSTGYFNTKERTITVFNQDSGMTFNEFYNSEFYDALYSSNFILTKWIEYTDEEKKDSPIRQCIGGYLKKYSYQQACANWWNNMSDNNKNIVQRISNFDKEIFEEITGIEL